MGAAGAALGTTLSQTISVIVALYAIRKKQTGIRLQKSDFKLHGTTMGQILQIGIPVALQDGFIQIAFIVITIIANRRGLNEAAAVGIVEKIIGVVFLVPSTMLSSVSALSAEYWSGQARPGNRNVALCAFDYGWIRYCGGHCDAVCKLPCRWIVYR